MSTPIASALRWIANESGIRFILRRKTAAAVAVLTMALALGANTAVFSVLNTFLLGSIAVPEPERLAVVAPVRDLPGRGPVLFSDAYPNYELLKATQHAFADVTCVAQSVASWDDGTDVRPLQVSRVTASFFSTMRVFPAVGRAFDASEEGPSPARVVVISDALWSSAFTREPSAVGRSMLINGESYAVIGVMPPGFTQIAPTDIWLPFDIPQAARTSITGARNLSVYARLKDGAPFESGVAEMNAFTKRTLDANSVDNKDFRYEFRPIRTVLLAGAESTVVLVQIGAVALLLLAIVNLASLLVAWGFDRRQEMAVRRALGARAGRITRMHLLQSLFIVGLGAAVGIVATRLALPWIRGIDITPTLTYFMQRVDLDRSVLGLCMAVAVAAGLLAGMLPAWFARDTDLQDSLRSGSRAVTLSPVALRWQQGMVVLQSAFSLIILAAAALIIISFRNASLVPIGFDPRNLAVARVQFPPMATHAQRAAFMQAFEANLAREPDIAAFGATSTLPVSDLLTGGRFFLEQPDGSPSSEPLLLHYRRVSSTYLTTIGIPLLRGRQFDSRDDSSGTPVAIVSRSLSDRVWPGQDPIGKRIYRVVAGRAPEPLEIVGVTGNVMDAGSRVPPGEAVYVPWARISNARLSLVVAPRTTEEAAITAVRHALRGTDATLAAFAVASLSDLVRQTNVLPRLQSVLLLIFAAVAVVITALGSYGVMSQIVANREREYALRLVFGAAPASLGRSVMAQLARFAIPGIAVGFVAAFALGSALRAFVFGIAPRSVGVLLGVSTMLLVIVFVAALPAAARAMRVDIRSY